ncbi:MAG: SUMF1/EgtB/PvdO family nonheme iron enzyme [Pyrinomonadaceae bacterium]|nr:SUMF1/EgtB/PvdO family nonheme iron enzyme [Sphingobacteriaceae bacterium]
MKKILSTVALLLCIHLTQAQGNEFSSLPISSLELPSELRKYVKKNYLFIDGSGFSERFRGSDSVNLIPKNLVTTIRPRYINKNEVSVEEYMNFVTENKGVYRKVNLHPFAESLEGFPQNFLSQYLKDKSHKHHPMVGINRDQAMAYCEWFTQVLRLRFEAKGNFYIFGHLQTDADFRVAALLAFGTKNRNYRNENTPPGDEYKANANYNNKHLLNPFSKANQNKAPKLEIYNITGNVAEWVIDSPRDIKVEIKKDGKYITTGDYHFKIPKELKDKGTKLGIVKGGSFNQSAFYLQPGISVPLEADKGYLWVGFRPVINFYKKEEKKSQAAPN